MRCPHFLQSVRHYLRRTGRLGTRRPHVAKARLGVSTLERRDLLSGVWTQVMPPTGTGVPVVQHEMLLSDGSVLLQSGYDNPSSNWWRLTADSTGNYARPTITRLASSNVARLFYASDVLRDGRVFVFGGEYSGNDQPPQQNETNTGEIYDPQANTWTNIASYPQGNFGDGQSEVLPDGRVLTGYLDGTECYVYDPSSNSWSQAASKLFNDNNNEEGWVKLPDGSILTVDVWGNQANGTQRYVPQLNQWVDSGTTPAPLATDSSYGGLQDEIGPGILLPDGRVFWIGGTGHTALYTPSTSLTGTGTWIAGPDIPGGLGATDAPAALEPNGNVLFSAQALNGSYTNIQNLFEYNPTTNQITAVSPPSNASAYNFNQQNFLTRMLVLPTGQILYSSDLDTLWLYTPDSTLAPNPAWAPTITDIAANGTDSFTLTGTQLEGLSEGSTYGDDAQNASNFPLVRLTDPQGNVSYARTFNFNPNGSTTVQTGSAPVQTDFNLTGGTNNGTYLVQAVANGIASDPALLVLANNSVFNITLQTDPSNGDYQILFNGSVVNEYAPSAFSKVFVVTGTTNTVVNVHETLAGVPVTVDGNGTDIIHVGDSQGVQNIQGNLYLENVPNYNSVIVDDTNDGVNIGHDVNIGTTTDALGHAWGTITGLAPASINYRLADTASGIAIGAGTSADVFTITGGASFQAIDLTGGPGNDTFNVQDTFAPVQIDGGGGSDQVNLGNGTVSGLSGAVSVRDTGGSAYLLVEDFADTVGRTVALNDGSLTGLAPATISWTPTATGSGGVNYLHVLGGQGNNTWNVYNTSNFGPIIGGGYTWIQTGNGSNSSNTVNLQSTQGGLYVDGGSSVQNVLIGSNAPSGNGTVQGINGFVFVENSSSSGASLLTIDDSGDTTARTATLRDGNLTGLAPAPIYWSSNAAGTLQGGVAYLRLYGGSGGNTWNIANTSNFYIGTYLHTGSGQGSADTFNVQATSGPLEVDAANDNAIVTVGSLAPSQGGTVAGIQGTVTIDNQSGIGTTQLTIDDSGDSTARTVTVNDGSVTGLAPAAIQWIDYHSSGLGVGGVTSLKVQGGSGGNTFTVTNTSPISDATLLSAGTGNDTVNVQATLGFLYVYNPSGNDTVTVGSSAPNIGGSLATIQGGLDIYGAGSTNLIVDDSADIANRTVTFSDDGAGDGALSGLGPNVIYWVATEGATGGVSSLKVYGGSGYNTYDINQLSGFAHGATLATGTAVNIVNVLSTTGALSVDGQAGDVEVNVGNNGSVRAIHGAVDVYNSSSFGYSDIFVNDSQDTTSQTATLTDGMLSGLAPAAIQWTPNVAGSPAGGVSWLVIYGGSGGNTFNVSNTSPFYYSTDLYPGVGNDVVNVQDSRGPINVDNAGGTDSDTIGSLAPALGGTLANIKGQVDLNGVANILVADGGDATVRTATLTSDELTGLGNSAPIFYSSAATGLTIQGGKAADTYNILSTSGNAVTTIQGGAARDTFNVGGTGSTGLLDNIQGPLTVLGNGGHNTLNVDDQGSAVGHMYVLSASTLSRDGNMPISFSGIQSFTLLGDASGNTLVVSALPSASSLVALGSGINTLTGPNSTNTWTINGPNYGTLDTKLAYVGVENLVGGTGNDTFKFAGVSPVLSGTISGGLGKNTLDYSGYTGTPATINLQTQSATHLNNGTPGGFSGITSVVGKLGRGATLIGPDSNTPWLVTAQDAGKAGAFAFSGIDNLVGGAGNDSFKISNGKGVAGSINGGGGSNTLDYSAWTTGVTVNLGAGTATGVAGGVSNFTILTSGSGSDYLTGGAGTDIIRGGSGNDSITAGSGSDILIGGSGADVITGGAARSILIADHGPATLNGGSAGDILIGGYTSYDANTSTNNKALLALLNEWTSSDSYTTRIARMRAGLLGGYKLSSATVHDVVGDVLNGQANYPADPDWFWAASATEIHDADGGSEQIN